MSLYQDGVVILAATTPVQSANFKLNWLDYRKFTRVAFHAAVDNPNSPGPITAGDPIAFSLHLHAASYVPKGVTYKWDFGDGTVVTDSTGADKTHTYAKGIPTLTVTIIDNRKTQVIAKSETGLQVQ